MVMDSGRITHLRCAAVLNGGISLIVVGAVTAAYVAVAGATTSVFLVGLLAWIVAGCQGLFHVHLTRDDLRVVPVAVLAALGSSALLAVGSSLSGNSDPFDGALFVAVIAAAALIVGVLAGRGVLRVLWMNDKFRSSVVVAGGGAMTAELVLELMHRRELGIDVVDVVNLENGSRESRIEAAKRLTDSISLHAPDRLIVGDVVDDGALLQPLRLAGSIGTRVYVLPRLFNMGIGTSPFSPDRLRGFPLQRLNRPTHPAIASATKRVIDVVGSALSLVVLFPLLLVVSALVKLTSPGPLLFWQERLGRDGERILIAKFRSMTTNSASDFEWTAENRITRVGATLRRTAIDEIPQLWMVLRGEMSLVGPRPERPEFASRFTVQHDEYEARLRMRPGITGLAQIAGLRGDTSISERIKYDNLYIDQWSLLGDLMIIARTAGAIVGQRRRAEAQLDFEDALAKMATSPTNAGPATATATATATDETLLHLGALDLLADPVAVGQGQGHMSHG